MPKPTQSPDSRLPIPDSRPSLPAPVFHDPRHHIKIFQGDCLEILAAIPESTVDLIFADPPYFLSNDGITCHAGRMVSVNKGAWDRSRGPDANHEFNRAWLGACQRILKPNGTLWVSGTAHIIHSAGFAMQQLGFKLLNDISWVKPNPPPNLSCRYFTHSTETIIWAAKNKKSHHTFHYKLMKQLAGGKQMKSVWQIPPPEPWEKRFGKHPTQKPVALLERILLASSNEGDLVLDPFLGSGTTAIAALRLLRSVWGIEISAAYVELALSRIGTVLVSVVFSALALHFDVDPIARSVDRSAQDVKSGKSTKSEKRFKSRATGPPMSPNSKLVHRERKFYFVGLLEREIVFSVCADSLDDAWQFFLASSSREIPIISIVKTETEIYLAHQT
jgi:site-specific DNA-methyltransferase (adenine-specific)